MKNVSKNRNIHFVGIGGSGMSAIAEVLISCGYNISGSDLKSTNITERLKKLGVKIFIGHNAENIKSVDILVVSRAIINNNPELISAKRNKIPIISRAEMLAKITKSKYTITVTGTHGKTTISSLVSLVLDNCGLDPTIIIGGELNNIKTNGRFGIGDYVVVESDESDGSFLKLSPTIAVVSNIDNDHLDFYDDMENLKKTFLKHINSVSSHYGIAIVCSDDRNIKNIIPKINKKYITYGFNGNPDIKALNVRILKNFRMKFDVFYKKNTIGDICIKIPGKHNVLNSLAAIGVGLFLKIPFDLIAKAINKFDGVVRRFDIKGEKKGIMIIDDYAHHPTAIISTLKTIKYVWPRRRLIVLFQPHRYTRTNNLFEDFGKSFTSADIVNVLDIYSAGEQQIEGVSSELILKSLISNKCNAVKFFDLKRILNMLSIGDIVLTLGAGDIWKKGEELLNII
ncbi:MAG: UDP-N-acetylmuramate--L-alanine ligase [Endomicrobium sp.]|nr:UDP-N-acetylmuramate--L-alanine ligase [Endomicrobium sp.]